MILAIGITAILVGAALGWLAHLLHGDRGMLWRPGDGNPQDDPTGPDSPTDHDIDGSASDDQEGAER